MTEKQRAKAKGKKFSSSKTNREREKAAKRKREEIQDALRESEHAEEKIRERLMATAERSSELGGRVLVHRYANGTVDGEIAYHVPRGMTEDELYRELLRAFRQSNTGMNDEHYWISLGQRYEIKEDDEVYRRNKGMNEIATYYANLRRSGIVAATFGAARDLMAPGAHKKYGRKASVVFIRMHWNPSKSKPER